jgi:hypothetical protein
MLELYIKYLLEGIAVAVAAYFIPKKKVNMTEIMFIALSAAATFAILDVFAPSVGEGARKGAGFGIGANTVGWPGMERFEDKKKKKTAAAAGTAGAAHEADDSMMEEEDSDVEGEKEGFYGDDSMESMDVAPPKKSDKHSGGIMGYDNNKAFSTF